MRFEDINEKGRIEHIGGERRLFRFEYPNNFYGSCTFTAKIVERQNRLNLVANSISLEDHLEDHEVKKGSLPALLGLAKAFFRAALANYSSLNQLGDDPPSD